MVDRSSDGRNAVIDWKSLPRNAPHGVRRRNMSQADDDDEMKSEYDSRSGVRGKYAKRVRRDSIVVSIDPELSIEFPTAEAVNEGLRELLRRRLADAGE